MALVFFDGFEHFAIGDILKKWSTYSTPASPRTMAMATGRLGTGQCLRCYGNGSTGSMYGRTVSFVLPTWPNTMTFGVAMKRNSWDPTPPVWYNANHAIAFGVGDARQAGLGPQVGFCLLEGGVVRADLCRYNQGVMESIMLGQASSSIALNAWFYFEAKVVSHATTGSVTVRVNGTQIMNLTNVNTNPQGTAVINALRLDGLCNAGYGEYQNFYDVWYDDVYILDPQTGLTDFLGDVRVDAHYPNANGTASQWSRSTGADQYATIDETLASETDYNYTGVVGNKDTVNVENFKNPGGTIYAVQTNLWAKKTDAGGGSISPVIRHNSTDTDGISVPLSTDFLDMRQVYEQNPGPAIAWNETDFNAAEFGYKKRA